MTAIRLLLLVGGYASAGELVLRRRSRSLVSWNESFWAGGGLFSAALILLSRVSRTAVAPLVAALPVLMVLAIALRARRRVVNRTEGDGKASVRTSAAAVPLAIAVLAIGAFVWLNGRTGFVTDGFSIWVSKARILSIEGHLDEAFRQPELLGRVANYPPLVPLSEVILGRGAAEFDYRAAKSVFPVFFVSLLVATFGAARRLLPGSLLLWAPAAVALLPWVSTDWNAGGFADMPLAAAVATMVGAWLDRFVKPDERPADVWVAGAAVLTKPEGLVSVACLVVVSLAFLRSRIRRPISALAPLIGFAAIVALYRRWFGVSEGVYGPIDAAHLMVATKRVWRVIAGCADMAFSWKGWGVFWIAVFAAAVIVLSTRPGPARALAAFVGLTGAAFASIFLFSNWEFPGPMRYGHQTLAFHIHLAFPRLLEQLSGPAAVLLLAGYDVISSSGRRSPRTGTAP